MFEKNPIVVWCLFEMRPLSEFVLSWDLAKPAKFLFSFLDASGIGNMLLFPGSY